LFGGKKDDAGKPVGDYYLDADSAKTLGDVEYMRKRKKVRRTFPTGAEVVEEVSSIDKQELTEEVAPKNTTPEPTFEPKKTAGGTSAEASSVNMDIFRKMAKDIKRRWPLAFLRQGKQVLRLLSLPQIPLVAGQISGEFPLHSSVDK